MGTIVSPERPERLPTMGHISPPFMCPMPPERRTCSCISELGDSSNQSVGKKTCASFIAKVGPDPVYGRLTRIGAPPLRDNLILFAQVGYCHLFPEKSPTTPSRNLYVFSRRTDGVPTWYSNKTFHRRLLGEKWAYREMTSYVSTATSEVGETLLLRKIIGARKFERADASQLIVRWRVLACWCSGFNALLNFDWRSIHWPVSKKGLNGRRGKGKREKLMAWALRMRRRRQDLMQGVASSVRSGIPPFLPRRERMNAVDLVTYPSVSRYDLVGS